MSKSGKDNISKRQHLEQVEKQTGKRPEELEGPKFPHLISHVWSAFLSISQSRTMGFNGPNPISLLEIRAWVEMTNATLSSREVEAIRELDVIYMRSFNG
tara:strand:+ start:505 stop:804 length:300 start_codon:yes stop_codon:yes gene_type:complete